MQAGDPFRAQGRWWRGNLHTHTTLSDGLCTPEAAVAFYRDLGYHFVALTDHWRWSVTRFEGSLLVLGGIEVDGVDPAAGVYHLVGLAAERPATLQRPEDGLHPPLDAAIAGLRAAGAAAVMLAHPYWSGEMSRDLLGLDGCCALEIYNANCEVLNGKGLSTVHWDDVLASGRRLWGAAVDDAHWGDHSLDAGLGWVWLRAPELSRAAICAALEQGHFYASSGPEIRDFAMAGGAAYVRCSPAAVIDFGGFGRYSQRVTAPPGATLAEAECRLDPRQRYVRVTCRDQAGRQAWSNPLFLG